MNKKLLMGLLMLVLLSSPAFAVRKHYTVNIVDEFGNAPTDLTTVTVYDDGTTTARTVYSTQTGTTEVGSSGVITAGLSDGVTEFWCDEAALKYTITNGTSSVTKDNVTPYGDTRIMYPTFLIAATTTVYDDDGSITMGDSSDVVMQWIAGSDALRFTPNADNTAFDIGTSGTTLNMDFNVYTGTAVGLKIDAGVPSLTWDGGAATLNHNSNFNVGLCTGTSTGAVTIGSSTAGVITIDSTSTGTINTDGELGLTTSDAGADIIVNSVLGRVIIEGEEDAADAVLITADGSTASTLRLFNDTGTSVTEGAASIQLLSDVGGICLESNANLAKAIQIVADAGTTESIYIQADQGTAAAAATESDAAIQLVADVGGIGLLSGLNAANAIRLEANAGTSETIVLHSNQGTGAASIQLLSDVGGITGTASAGAITLTATGATAGDMTLTVGDDFSLDVTGTATYKGALYEDSRYTLTKSANFTISDVNECGALILVDTAAVVITLPAVAVGHEYTIMNVGADGTEIHVDTNASDLFLGGCNIDATDDGDKLTNSAATADKGDYVTVRYGGATGWLITAMNGTWVDGG